MSSSRKMRRSGRRCDGSMGTSSLEISGIKCIGLTPPEGEEIVSPVVTIDFCGITKGTEEKENEFNPEYDEVLVFDAYGKTISPEDVLIVRVKDGDVLIGAASVSVKELSNPGTTVAQYSVNLNNRDGTQTKGKVKFRVEYIAVMAEVPEEKQNEIIINEPDDIPADKIKPLPVLAQISDEMASGYLSAGDSENDQLSSVEAEDDFDSEEFEEAEPAVSREHNLPDKPTFFQVRIKIIKACNLPGSNIDPSVRVTVGTQKKQTKSIKSSTKPFFNETFFFNFNERPNEVFDKLLKFEVYNTRPVLSCPLLGSFTCDAGLVYFQKEHSVVKKWILMSATDDSRDTSVGSAAGFVQITAIVLGPGDELPDKVKADVDNDDTDDIESNCWMPVGVRLQPATFLFKVYRAEDLPHKPPKSSKKEGSSTRRSFRGQKDNIKCDSYCKFIFSGKKGKTRVKRHTFNPEFNEEIAVPFRFPSMCETLKIQLLDWNRVRMDNVIGNNLLSLSEISSLGNRDFLPSFGPCFINFYGTSHSTGNNRLSLATQQIGTTINKVQVGDDYKGRALVEITTRLGKHTKGPKRYLETRELIRIKPYLERKKYKLFNTFLSANLMSHKDDAVRFEISIGNYGNTKDDDGDILSSSTLAADTVHDGTAYHYLPWKETKPCCVVECHWEDTSFRLEPMNMVRNIAQRLDRNISVLELAIKLNIKVKAQESEIALLIIRILDHFIGDCNNPLPTFTEKTSGITNLDLKMQEIRQAGLEEVISEATSYREDATDIHDALVVLKEYLKRLKTLCTEPQNSLPDVVISMIVGSKRVAYYRMPSEDVLYSKNPFCKGMYCGKQQNVTLKYIGKKENDLEQHPDLPASLNVIMWLGLEEDQADFIDSKNLEGKYAVYAETYENQCKLPMLGWTSDSCPRPAYSNSDGDTPLNKEDFIPPQGWAWDESPQGEWCVDPEIVVHDYSQDHEDGCHEFTVDIIENEVRADDGIWKLADEPYTTEKGDPMQHKDEIILPEDWSDWAIDMRRTCDAEGWEYKQTEVQRDWSPTMKPHHMIRRRRLQRKHVFKQSEIKKIDFDADDIGWVYAGSLAKKFHRVERKKDAIRRRKWRRKMVVSELGAPPVFCIPGKDKKKAMTITPRMVLVYDKSHKWQLRAYIHQARNVRPMDDDGLSDPYAVVSFNNQTQQTYTIKKTLCPEWDQTLLFENINLYGEPTSFAENPPYVCINFFDKHIIGKDDFLGRCLIQPTVRLDGSKGPSSRLLWHPIKRGTRECGELLATFELFLDEGADLPFTPPTKDNRYIVPTGIRPVIVRTGVEVLCWGVRNLKKHQLANCTSPSVSIQIGNQVIKSDKIKNTKKNPNFEKNSYFLEMYLPKEPIYMHPINIIVRDHRSFGRKPIIGTHVITNLSLDKPPNNEISLISNESDDTDDNAKLTKSQFAIEMEEGEENEEDRKEQETDDEIHLDWWSKYYASVGQEKKCGSYLEDGHKPINVYRTELEEVEEFGGLIDFANTYPLLRGKGQEEEEGTIAGEFKGSFKIYPLSINPKEKSSRLRYYSHKRFKSTRPEDYMVRVYITRAIDLRPTDANGKSDPYLTVKLGSKKFSTKERYIPNELNPYFGEFFEFKCQIPVSKDLKIKVMDYDIIGRNDLIGKTVIDLENRILTKARATVGLPPTYYTSGPYKWRDVRKPKELLEDVSLSKPKYISETRIVVNGKTFDLEDFEDPIESASYLGPCDERLALHILNNEKFEGMRLIPEHVETRSLLNPLEPNMDQGQLEMFVDIFPLRAAYALPGPPINVTPRKPKSYELRVIIWNTADVELVDKSITGEEMSDIYVKAWLDGFKKKSMKTDTHYRSLNGDGNFNWRMIFPFQYLPEESVMIIEKKEHFWSLDKTRRFVPPKISVQVWDQDFFSSNDFIGSLEVNLNKLPFPTKTKDDCNISMLSDQANFIDLFKTKVCKGWWIMIGKDKKEGFLEEKGKVEMTMEILSKEEADERLAGKGRDEPNMNPTLGAPERPQSSFLWYKNLKKAFLYVIWKRYKCLLVWLIIIVLLLLAALLFMYDLVGYGTKKMVGA